MQPHDELLHYGVRGMRWGVRKASDKAKMYQRKAQETSNKVRDIARSGIRTDAQGNSYMRIGDVSKVNRLSRKYDKYTEKAKKYQKLSAKKLDNTMKQPMRKTDQKKHLTTFQKTAASVGTGVLVGGILAPLVRPTADMFGKSIAKYVSAKVTPDSIFKYKIKDMTPL